MKYTFSVTRMETCKVTVEAPDAATAKELAYAEAIDLHYDKQDWETVSIRTQFAGATW